MVGLLGALHCQLMMMAVRRIAETFKDLVGGTRADGLWRRWFEQEERERIHEWMTEHSPYAWQMTDPVLPLWSARQLSVSGLFQRRFKNTKWILAKERKV